MANRTADIEVDAFLDEFSCNAGLDHTFFCDLERVGGVRLSEQHRYRIKVAVFEYAAPGPIGGTPAQQQRIMKAVSKHTGALLRMLEHHGDTISSRLELFHYTPPWHGRSAEWWQIVGALQTFKEVADCALCEKPQTQRAHRPLNLRAIELVQACGAVYAKAGGRPKISNNKQEYRGPYNDFLKAIWGALPNNQRPSSPNAFARIAIEYSAKRKSAKRKSAAKSITRTARKR
jgi:hypothetical protein